MWQDQLLIVSLCAETVLIAVTWKLWTGGSAFPAVPLLKELSVVPMVVDQVLAAMMLGSLFGAIGVLVQRSRQATGFGRTSPDWLLTVFVFCGTAMGVLNQHRFQSWHWLTLLLVAQYLVLPPAERLRTWRITIATIYCFAALSRLSPDMGGSMSREILTTILAKGGAGHLTRNATWISVGCGLMTLAEFLTGLGLCWKPTRRLSVTVSMLMHLTLVTALGPWGLNHHHGVLCWNLFFLVAVPLLFVMCEEPAAPIHRTPSAKSRWIQFFLVLFPLSGLWGVADNWPSWQLYSPRPEVLKLYVHADDVSRLPPTLQPFVSPPAPLQDWCGVRLDRWSLNETNAPIYPEDRFQLAVAAFATGALPQDRFRVELDIPDEVRWWRRRRLEAQGLQGTVARYRSKLILNADTVRESSVIKEQMR